MAVDLSKYEELKEHTFFDRLGKVVKIHSHDKNLSIKFIIHLFTVIIKKIIIKYSQNYMLFFLFFQKL